MSGMEKRLNDWSGGFQPDLVVLRRKRFARALCNNLHEVFIQFSTGEQ